MIVRAKTLLMAELMISRSEPVGLSFSSSRMLSNTMTVSLIEYPTMHRIAATMGALNLWPVSTKTPIVIEDVVQRGDHRADAEAELEAERDVEEDDQHRDGDRLQRVQLDLLADDRADVLLADLLQARLRVRLLQGPRRGRRTCPPASRSSAPRRRRRGSSGS